MWNNYNSSSFRASGGHNNYCAGGSIIWKEQATLLSFVLGFIQRSKIVVRSLQLIRVTGSGKKGSGTVKLLQESRVRLMLPCYQTGVVVSLQRHGNF